MKTSVKSYSGLDPERCESTAFALPSTLVEMLDEMENLHEMPEGMDASPEYIANLMTSRQKAMIQGAFGKYAPKGYEKAKDTAFEELEEAASERGWKVTAEEQLACHVSIIQRLTDLEKWKKEQRKVRAGSIWEPFYRVVGRQNGKSITKRFYTSLDRANTEKVNGEWKNAQVYELPPIATEEIDLGLKAKHKKLASLGAVRGYQGNHEEAQYAFKHPDGTVVDLLRVQYRSEGELHNELTKRQNGVGMEQHMKMLKASHPDREYFAPVMRSEPNKAMQSIARRLGAKVKGGAHSIVQQLVGRDDIIPSYRTIWRKNRWLVLVAWQRDPKLAKSSFEVVNDRVQPSSGEDAMTVSEFDYSLFTDYSDLKIEDGEEIRYDYEDDESYMVGMNRDSVPEGIDMNQFAEDDDERELLMFLTFFGELDVIHLSHLDGSMAREALIGLEVSPGKWKGGIKGCRYLIKHTLPFLIDGQKDPVELAKLEKSLEWQKTVQLPKFERMLKTRLMLQEFHRDEDETTSTPDRSRRAVPEVIEGASELPLNRIQIHEPVTTEVEQIVPAQTLFRPTLANLQNGTVGVCKLADGTYATRFTKSSRKPYVTPKTASPALTRTLERIIGGCFRSAVAL